MQKYILLLYAARVTKQVCIQINIFTNFVFYHYMKFEWLVAFKTDKEIRQEMVKICTSKRNFLYVSGSCWWHNNKTHLLTKQNSRFFDEATAQTSIDQKIIQGYSRIKSIYNMRWRHRSSLIFISNFFSRLSRIGKISYGFTSCFRSGLKAVKNLHTQF